ncbi:MAG: AGE family epimerase/isomerase [Devosia sp.]
MSLVPWLRTLFGQGQDVAPSAEGLATLAAEMQRELDGNILPFWLKQARNPKTGGFWGEISFDGRKRLSGPRGALLTARILWTFAAAQSRDPRPDHLAMARYAYDDLTRHFTDPAHGGLHWSIGAKGDVLHGHKQVYVQVFGIYGLVEYHRATASTEALEQAQALYRLIEAHAADRGNDGYHEAMTADWSGTEEVLPDGGVALGHAKSQNTTLHVMEAYAALYEVWPDPALKAALIAVCRHLIDRIFDPATGHLRLFFDAGWKPVHEHFSPGHDLECAWLLRRAAQATGEAALIAQARTVTIALARSNLQIIEGDGALVYEAGPEGVVDPLKQWWVEAEAVVGYLEAYELTGEAAFYAAAINAWSFIKRRLIDRRRGEWFGDLTRAGRPVHASPKLSFWKCPYHNGRMCMEVIDRARRLGLRLND